MDNQKSLITPALDKVKIYKNSFILSWNTNILSENQFNLMEGLILEIRIWIIDTSPLILLIIIYDIIYIIQGTGEQTTCVISDWVNYLTNYFGKTKKHLDNHKLESFSRRAPSDSMSLDFFYLK